MANMVIQATKHLKKIFKGVNRETIWQVMEVLLKPDPGTISQVALPLEIRNSSARDTFIETPATSAQTRVSKYVPISTRA